MNVKKESLEKSQTKLTITLTADEFLPYVEKASRRIAEQIEIAGFRKGQAPMEMIRQKVGEMALHQEAAQIAVEKTLPEAIEKENLHTVGQPAIGIEKLAPGNDFVYTATVPLMPEVKLGDLNKVKVKPEEVKVDDAEVEKVIQNVLRLRAKEQLVDRAAKMGDKVEVDFDVYLDSVPVDGGTGKKYPLVLGEKTMIPGFEEQVVGLKAGETKEFKLAFPKDYHQKMLAGKETEFKVKVHSVFEIVPPELNDEFARTLGDFKTVAEMKAAVQKNLREEKEAQADGKFERDVLETLISVSTFGDIPDVMLTQETQVMMGELEQNIARQGLDFAEYLKHLKKDRKQLMLDLTPDAVKRIKSALVIRELAKKENVAATEEEIKAELDQLRHAYQGNSNVLRQIESASYREYIGNVVRNRKTIHWLKDQVKK